MQPVIAVRIFIASPSDVAPLRERAVQVATEWNAAHSLKNEAIIEAVRIETHLMAQGGDHPQEVINKQLLGRCDLLLAIFSSKLGSATNVEASGTVHEIKEFIRTKGASNVILMFSKTGHPDDVDSHQLEALRSFRKEMQEKNIYLTFQNEEGFASVLRQQLEMRMNAILTSDEAKGKWSERAKLNEADKIAVENMQEHQRISTEAYRVMSSNAIKKEIPAKAENRIYRTLPEEFVVLADYLSNRLSSNLRSIEDMRRFMMLVEQKYNSILATHQAEIDSSLGFSIAFNAPDFNRVTHFANDGKIEDITEHCWSIVYRIRDVGTLS